MENHSTSFAGPAQVASDQIFISEPKYAFIVLDRLSDRLPNAGAGAYYLSLSERDIDSLQGFEISDLARDADDRLLSRPFVGAILDADFLLSNPGAVIRLRQVAPNIPETDAIYNLSNGVEGLLDWQFSRAFGLSSGFLSDLSAGQLEIARLQQIAHDHFEALQEAQRFLEQAIPPPPRLCVFLPPSNASVRPAELPGVVGIAQGSKREFRAVHAYELHVAAVNPSSSTMVVVTLSAVHSRTVLATWTVPVSTLDTGWNRFDAPYMPGPLDEPVLIEIRWRPEDVPDLALSLGEITRDPRLGYSRSDGAVDERSLAVRIYEGVPGLKLPSHGWGKLADGETNLEQAGPIVIDELLPQAVYFGGLAEARSDLMHFVDERSGLLLHPNDTSAHVAVIRNVRMEHVRAIVADVMLAHEAASATEFGLFAARTDAKLTASQTSGRSDLPKWLRRASALLTGKEEEASSDDFVRGAEWLRLEGNESGQLMFEPSEPLPGRFDIYLATRQVGRDTSYAWAHFKHLALLRGRKAK